MPTYGNGEWALALPVGATQRAPWTAPGTSTPAFVALTATAGRYTVEASASGFASQSSAIDLSASDQSRSFGLVP